MALGERWYVARMTSLKRRRLPNPAAYAISVHRAQGSEYPAIVMPVVTDHFLMLRRSLLYTAITRGKRLVVLVGTRRAVSIAVRNDSTRQRWTWLAQRIRDAAAAAR